jgi:hypothetical protein
VIGQLAANNAGQLIDKIPRGLYNYGGGGINGWGATCGGPNGAVALLKQLGAPTAVMDEFNAWYERFAFPSNDAYNDYAYAIANPTDPNRWIPGGDSPTNAPTDDPKWGNGAHQLVVPLNNAPRSVAKCLECHASRTEWYKAAGGNTGYWLTHGGSLSDRCGKLTYDCVFKVATLINQWKAGTLPVGTGTIDPSAQATGCMSANCHAETGTSAVFKSAGKMKCTDSCHK